MKHSLEVPTVQTYTAAAPFLTYMEPLLLEQEARYSLMLGIALRVRHNPDAYGENLPYFAIAQDARGIAAAASMTPPHGIIAYSERADCRPGLTAIAHDIRNKGLPLPTVNGPEPVCTIFAEIWSEMNGVKAEIAVYERLFELREVIHPTYSPGHMRVATTDDLELLARWLVAFTDEALRGIEERTLDGARTFMQSRIEQGTIFVWEDGSEVVSIAGTTRPTAHGITIGLVYTPPHFRGKGYASSAVAQLSQLLLEQGRAFVTLFTDLANPTSNHIYQNIGYRPICDYTVYRFGGQPPIS